MTVVPCAICNSDESIHKCLRCGTDKISHWHVMPSLHKPDGVRHAHYTLCATCHEESGRRALKYYVRETLRQ